MNITKAEFVKKLTEELMIRRYQFYKQNLPLDFWKEEPYARQYKILLYQLYPIVNAYGVEVVTSVLIEDDYGSSIFSLKHPNLKSLLVKYDKIHKQSQSKQLPTDLELNDPQNSSEEPDLSTSTESVEENVHKEKLKAGRKPYVKRKNIL